MRAQRAQPRATTKHNSSSRAPQALYTTNNNYKTYVLLKLRYMQGFIGLTLLLIKLNRTIMDLHNGHVLYDGHNGAGQAVMAGSVFSPEMLRGWQMHDKITMGLVQYD